MKKVTMSFLILLVYIPLVYASIPTDGLVFYLTFDNCQVKDETGHVTKFFVSGNPQCVEGIKGEAFYFDGNDWIGADTFFPIDRGTIIVFVRPDRLIHNDEYMTILDSKTNFRSLFGFLSFSGDPVIRIGYPRAPFYDDYQGHWLMLAFVYFDGATHYGKRIAYLNGLKIGEQVGPVNEYAIPWYGNPNTFNLNIGVTDHLDRFLKDVAVDEIMFYDRPLSPREIQQIYNDILSVPLNTKKLSWKHEFLYDDSLQCVQPLSTLCSLYNFVFESCFFLEENILCNSDSILSNSVFGGYFTFDDLLYLYTFPYTSCDGHGCYDINDNEIDCGARIKLFRPINGGYGVYRWVAYVPYLESDAMVSVGMFLYKDDQHELDFECGGSRNQIVCYVTTQGNPYYSTVKGSKDYDPYYITPGWHVFEIVLVPAEEDNNNNNNYKVIWKIDNKIIKEKVLYYGPDDARFRQYVSVENLRFIGSKAPHNINWVVFSDISYTSSWPNSPNYSFPARDVIPLQGVILSKLNPNIVFHIPSMVKEGENFPIKIEVLDQNLFSLDPKIMLKLSLGKINPYLLSLSNTTPAWDGYIKIEEACGRVVLNPSLILNNSYMLNLSPISLLVECPSPECVPPVYTEGKEYTNIQDYFPEVPILIYPEEENLVDRNNLTFSWNVSANAETYHVQIASDITFLNVLYEVKDITTPFLNIPAEVLENQLQPGGIYYWRVRAVNECGESEWSEPSSFTIPIIDPKITIMTPEDGTALIMGEIVEISWIFQGDVGDTVKIRYNTGGRRWYTIASGVPVTDGIYFWTVPKKPTNRLRIKIESEQKRRINDITGYLTITE